MILAYWQNEWVTCGRGPAHGAGCGVGVRLALADWAQQLGMQRHVPAFWSKHLESIAGIRFFPEIRYRGVRVLPYSWHPTEAAPVLLVDVNPNDRDLYTRYFIKPPNNHDEMLRALKLDGWDVYDGREGAWKYVHVDELEKIEGPPPEGLF